MEGIERIHKLLDELAEVTKELFPDYSRISADCANDGYRNFTVLKWGKGETVETTKRRELFQQSRLNAKDKWEEDRSPIQNKYYERKGVLLKDD